MSDWFWKGEFGKLLNTKKVNRQDGRQSEETIKNEEKQTLFFEDILLECFVYFFPALIVVYLIFIYDYLLSLLYYLYLYYSSDESFHESHYFDQAKVTKRLRKELQDITAAPPDGASAGIDNRLDLLRCFL
jgi:hypothetical protein